MYSIFPDLAAFSAFIENQEILEFEKLRNTWYASVRTWPFSDIVKGRELIVSASAKIY